ncbi:unnamed protein product [Jaminaea pallidilutea]
MAKGASKKISSNNASSLKLLLYGFVITNALQLLLLFTPLLSSLRYRRSSTWTWDLVRYVLTEAVAAGIALVMRDMASKGEDLDAQGLTALMWDVVFVTWFIHAGTALIWRRLWWIYAVIPLYGLFLAYTKLVVPFVFKGQDPIAAIISKLAGAGSGAGGARSSHGSAPAQNEADALSKRQKKLLARADRGDARVQRREAKR